MAWLYIYMYMFVQRLQCGCWVRGGLILQSLVFSFRAGDGRATVYASTLMSHHTHTHTYMRPYNVGIASFPVSTPSFFSHGFFRMLCGKKAGSGDWERG